MCHKEDTCIYAESLPIWPWFIYSCTTRPWANTVNICANFVYKTEYSAHLAWLLRTLLWAWTMKTCAFSKNAQRHGKVAAKYCEKHWEESKVYPTSMKNSSSCHHSFSVLQWNHFSGYHHRNTLLNKYPGRYSVCGLSFPHFSTFQRIDYSAKYADFQMMTYHRLPNADLQSKGAKGAAESTDEAWEGSQNVTRSNLEISSQLRDRWKYG